MIYLACFWLGAAFAVFLLTSLSHMAVGIVAPLWKRVFKAIIWPKTFYDTYILLRSWYAIYHSPDQYRDHEKVC